MRRGPFDGPTTMGSPQAEGSFTSAITSSFICSSVRCCSFRFVIGAKDAVRGKLARLLPIDHLTECSLKIQPRPRSTTIMRIIAICGSLRKESSNAALLEAAARVAPGGVETVVYDG